LSFTVLIAEDDPAMRRVLKKIAEEDGRLRVVGEAGNGTEALALFEKLRPRIVFVDIDLPLKDGVSLARDIFAREPRTHFVFITASDDYREAAFEVYACDYLVKPFRLERLRQTLTRLADVLAGSAGDYRAGPDLSVSAGGPAGDTLFLLRTDSRTAVLDRKEILFVTREGRQTVVYHVHGRLETGDNLKTLADKLGGYPFFRTHKGFIVNLRMVREIVPAGRGTYELIMAHTNRRPLMTARKFREMERVLAAGKNTDTVI